MICPAATLGDGRPGIRQRLSLVKDVLQSQSLSVFHFLQSKRILVAPGRGGGVGGVEGGAMIEWACFHLLILDRVPAKKATRTTSSAVRTIADQTRQM